MDTLGTISPQLSETTNTQPRLEAAERLRYLALTGARGLLTGAAGTGKSWLLAELAGQLRREGLGVALIDLTGVEGREIPDLIGARLGLGIPASANPIELWSTLQDHAEAAQRINRRLAFLVDHFDQAPESVLPPLNRLMNAFNSRGAWIFAMRSTDPGRIHRFCHDHVWLRIELPELTRREAARILSRKLLSGKTPLRFSRQAVDAAWEASAGRIERLRQLAELASIAAEVEEVSEIDAALIQAVTEEMNG